VCEFSFFGSPQRRGLGKRGSPSGGRCGPAVGGWSGSLGTLPLQRSGPKAFSFQIDSLAPARLALRAGLRPVSPEAPCASGGRMRA